MNSTATLALDCSFAGLSLALQHADKTHVFTTETPRSSDILATELQRLLQQAAVTPADIGRICVTTGPGSFTGIRLGLATAQALKLLNPALTILGLSTLHALAQQIVAEHAPTTAFTILLDAAGGQTYSQTFAPDATPQTEASLTTAAPATPVVFAQASLMHPTATPVTTLKANYLLALSENPRHHLPPHPVYLKPLTYKKAAE